MISITICEMSNLIENGSREWDELQEWVYSIMMQNNISMSQFLRDILLFDDAQQKLYSIYFCKERNDCPIFLKQEIKQLQEFCQEYKKLGNRLQFITTEDSAIDILRNIAIIKLQNIYPDLQFEILSENKPYHVRLASQDTEYLKEIFIENCLGIPVNVQMEKL